ncbi:2',3'-cyclic-nucleotide 3'-phosphodiesterase [Syngnathoides biaculeatus]|uniref:2',3'-cyclic-nucleotide 3'-phosphodiesterase n=1 Tax=Syngnathoides biaculeatus TaxID=300417 RepID=UPI002ADDE509|nr:2',3'-cyclic-nucleotide 3'-phosphodiesterase [Syngnathoides biaculeatus]
MDPEKNSEVPEKLESPQQEVEAAVVTQLEESAGPEKPAAADEEEEKKEQPAVNGSGDAAANDNVPVEDDSPCETSEAKPTVPVAAPEEPDTEPEKRDLEPEKENKPETELVAQTIQEEAAPRQLAEPQPPSPEKVEAVAEAQQEVVKEASTQDGGKGVEVSEEKPAEASVQGEEVKVAETLPPAEPKKEGELEKTAKSGDPTSGEPSAAAIVPSADSLAFPLLQHEKTKDALLGSRTLVVIRGLPGSGKTFLSRALADAYKDRCSVFCADDYAESGESGADAHKALDEAVVACCADVPSVLVVVDDTNHTLERLARLGELAREHRMVAVFLEPRTEWCTDAAHLAKVTGRKPAVVTAMKRQLDEVRLPLFFGWFLLSPMQDQLRSMSSDFLTALDAFKKNAVGSSVKEGQEVPLDQYFQPKGSLHCTTKFCDYGKAEGAKEYAEKPAVSELYGSVFDLKVSALFVTPRTFGARVRLTEEQLVLWPADAEKEAEASVPGAAALPMGSRAHITLGCAAGVEPVQTGLDLLEILVLNQVEPVTDLELGSLRFYGEGRWMLELKEPMCAAACFSSFYKRKGPSHEQGKKEPKKKKNCAIL